MYVCMRESVRVVPERVCVYTSRSYSVTSEYFPSWQLLPTHDQGLRLLLQEHLKRFSAETQASALILTP